MNGKLGESLPDKQEHPPLKSKMFKGIVKIEKIISQRETLFEFENNITGI
jgi:hypothetical protein